VEAVRAEAVRVEAPRADAAMRAEVQAIARGEMPAARPEPARPAPTLRVAPRIEPAPEAPRDELAARRAPDARAAAPVIDRSPPPRAPAGDAPLPDMPFGDAPPFDGESPPHLNEMPPLDDVPPFDAHASRSARAPVPPNARPAITTERGPDARPAPRPANGAGHASAHSTGASHPAAPAAAHGTRPGGPNDTRAAWAEVLNALEARRKLRLFGWYEQASVLLWTGEALEVGFTADLHSLGEMAREPDAIAEMRAFLADHLGHPVTLSIKLLDAAASAAAPVKSIVEETRARAAEDRKIRETEAREHPVTKLVLETFGAQIKEIKTDV
ncbi:MAG: hypothetical protein K8W52_44545, partial [Deltaproteobacteria bacterium]|nr:hypothetical protein [Deltaproteobacteria bacterium]